MFENETFPIFAHLQAKERARENNRFSVLKSLPARTAHAPQAHREARAPYGGAGLAVGLRCVCRTGGEAF